MSILDSLITGTVIPTFSIDAGFIGSDMQDIVVEYTEVSRSEVGTTLTALYTKYPNFKATCRAEIPKYTPLSSSNVNTAFAEAEKNSASTLSVFIGLLASYWLNHCRNNKDK
ncbi:hypothetical protein [Vibrio phage R01]|nr:hypothetical protein [Vibrio phage R01]